jgi:hypothetical protein
MRIKEKQNFIQKGFPAGSLMLFSMTWLNSQLSVYVVNCDIYINTSDDIDRQNNDLYPH